MKTTKVSKGSPGIKYQGVSSSGAVQGFVSKVGADREVFIESSNKFFVGTMADGVMILRPPKAGLLSHEDAVNLAAWLVAASSSRDAFGHLLDAIYPEDK